MLVIIIDGSKEASAISLAEHSRHWLFLHRQQTHNVNSLIIKQYPQKAYPQEIRSPRQSTRSLQRSQNALRKKTHLILLKQSYILPFNPSSIIKSACLKPGSHHRVSFEFVSANTGRERLVNIQHFFSASLLFSLN